MITFIDPANIHSVWDEIKKGLEVIKGKGVERWRIEDVYASIKSNYAQLFTLPDGFIVLQSVKCPWTGEPILHIWIAFHSTNEDVTDIFKEDLKRLRDNIGAKRITFTSPRRWERRAGAELRSYNYELDLGD